LKRDHFLVKCNISLQVKSRNLDIRAIILYQQHCTGNKPGSVEILKPGTDNARLCTEFSWIALVRSKCSAVCFHFLGCQWTISDNRQAFRRGHWGNSKSRSPVQAGWICPRKFLQKNFTACR